MEEKPHGGRESAMVIRIAALTLLLLQNHGAVAGTMSRDNAERAVVRESIEITTNGAWSADISEDERADACSVVILRQADVGAFFKRASRVTERAYSHDLDAANCYAEGRARLANGGVVKWKIDQARRGFVSMPNGRTIYLYCPRCQTDWFAPN
ncbi:hypothetical protein [Burkholderia ubonensis]|uniref:hypothetical protein n=1 Tax=Burkholderia ubonensis TaxID=101571 RepID=UPI00075431B9|nr:hypothetical protein [Burkholderia ubonensis]KVC72843.1 hypothetical protein WI74_20345 [Burkholderia ubonensis]KVC76532.1 hypothetical protein WI75_18880 [Burkholderia ubonensis]KVL65360.1 hypothetical protein WJ48_18375 [Burkholderia ubonensis]KVL80189.1 hypothetical protein WJ49_06750 [Burkholderia ubonensis]KVL82480.1 hypothetical protein WJ50_02040 [Burkholderia ubonensis]